MEFVKEMNAYCKHVNEEDKRIHNILVEYVKRNGGEIDTSNEDDHNDDIYAVVYNEYASRYEDFRVDRVRVVDNCLEVHLSDYYSKDEDDMWFSVTGGMVLVNATLYWLCECLPEYINEVVEI